MRVWYLTVKPKNAGYNTSVKKAEEKSIQLKEFLKLPKSWEYHVAVQWKVKSIQVK